MWENKLQLQVSAAEGAEEFYTTTNNIARKEPIELAIELDRKTQQVSHTC